jgi:hypothetical protein
MKFDPSARFQSALDAIRALAKSDFSEEMIEQRMVANSAPVTAEEPPQRKLETPVPTTSAANADKPIALTASASTQAPSETQPFQATPVEPEPLDAAPWDVEPSASGLAEPEVSATPVDERSEFAEAANSDHQGERIPQPTERIDLERIKEIIAKDTQKKAELAARKNPAAQDQEISKAVRDAQGPRSKSKSAIEQSEPYSMKNKNTATTGPKNALLAAFREIPPKLRPAVVGLGAALLTITSVALYQMLSVGGKNSSAQESVASVAEDSTKQEAGTSASNAVASDEPFQFPHIPEGTYVGHIDDLIPGVRAPVTLISKPLQRQIVVIFGIAGWTPALVSTESEYNTPSSTLVIRSNGMILYVTGELSSDTIVGGFTNAVTGESGIWRVSKLS